MSKSWKTDARSVANRQKWVGALLSGKYQQGRLKLRTNDGRFCCLGVACEVSGVGQWLSDGTFVTREDKASTVLPKEVRRWLGVNNAHAEMVDESAPYLNDFANFTFDDIAMAILFEEEYQRTDGDA